MPNDRNAVTKDEEQLHRPGTLSDDTNQKRVDSDSKLNLEHLIELQQFRIPSAAADSRGATNDTRVTQAGTEVISANRLIDGLSGSQKDLWREYQITLVDEMNNP